MLATSAVNTVICPFIAFAGRWLALGTASDEVIHALQSTVDRNCLLYQRHAITVKVRGGGYPSAWARFSVLAGRTRYVTAERVSLSSVLAVVTSHGDCVLVIAVNPLVLLVHSERRARPWRSGRIP